MGGPGSGKATSRFQRVGDKPRRLLGGAKLLRGTRAKRGFVAWNQPSLYELSTYNTVRPFWHARKALRRAVKASRHREEETRLLQALDWIETMEKKRDWREVLEEKVAELETLAETIKKMALWHLGVSEDHGALRPFGEEKPAAWKGGSLIESSSHIILACAVARCRIDDTKTLAVRKMLERKKISESIDEAESERRVAAWQATAGKGA